MASRRKFLQLSGATSVAVSTPFNALMAQVEAATTTAENPWPWRSDGGYGPLQLTADENTGQNLLRLPAGFRYRSYGWTGQPMTDGNKHPARHDGMAVVRQRGHELTLIRNHEVTDDKGAFGGKRNTYDPMAGGGCTRLVFDTRRERFVKSEVALAGTLANCAGGPTPWGSWLSGEEMIMNPGYTYEEEGETKQVALEKSHGFMFEVPGKGRINPEPIKAMGQFAHEAAAVDPDSGIVYETEDRRAEAGFYRYLPNQPGKLHAGGKLQMLCVAGRDQMTTDVPLGQRFATHWVDIENPEQGHSPGTTDWSGVISQGKAAGGTPFTRLEGCWYADGEIYFTSTDGGSAKRGQVYAYDPRDATVRLLFESPGKDVLDYPDNLTISPRGGIMLCEDGTREGQMLMGLSQAGELFPFAQNNLIFDGSWNDLTADWRAMEWCGACFSPDGQWLFVNIQTPGVTFAITGPWEKGLI